MDIDDWISGIYNEDVVQGGESLFDRARRINSEEMAIILVLVPLMELRTGNPSGTAGRQVDEEEEEEHKERKEPKEEEKEGHHEEFVTAFT